MSPRASYLAATIACVVALALDACDVSSAPEDAGGSPEAGPDQASEASISSPCSTIGVTGEAPRCNVFAYCPTGDYELDCNHDDGRCRCRIVTGKGRAEVAYDPAFCSIPDGGSAAEISAQLAAAFAAATRACEWTP